MASDRNDDPDPDHRVIPFRRPVGARKPVPKAGPERPVPDLKRFERREDESPEDYRHRMLVNGLGVLVAIAVVAAGWWIADSMARQRQNQDCVLAGRKNCATLDVPSR